MRNPKLRFAAAFLSVVLLIGAAVMPALGSPAVTGKVMIYTSIYLHIIEQLKPVLKQQFPNLDVEFFYGGSERVIAKLETEFAQGGTPADVIMIADPAYYLTLKRDNRLLQHRSPNHKFVFPDWVDKDEFWSGVRVNVMGIAYNKNLVAEKDIPKTWWDLADPKWRGRVGMPSPLLSGTAFATTAGLSQSPKHGWDYFTALRRNNIAVESGNGAVETKLLSGQFAVGMILEENILRAMTENKPLGFVYPTDGPVVIHAPIGIMRTTKNPDGAKAVYDFFLSQAGQRAILDGWMPSVRPDMPAPQFAAAKIEEVRKIGLPMNWEWISRNSELVKERFDRIMR